MADKKKEKEMTPMLSRKDHNKKHSPKGTWPEGALINSPVVKMMEEKAPIFGYFTKTISGRATEESLAEQREGIKRIKRLRGQV